MTRRMHPSIPVKAGKEKVLRELDIFMMLYLEQKRGRFGLIQQRWSRCFLYSILRHIRCILASHVLLDLKLAYQAR